MAPKIMSTGVHILETGVDILPPHAPLRILALPADEHRTPATTPVTARRMLRVAPQRHLSPIHPPTWQLQPDAVPYPYIMRCLLP